MLVLVLVVGFVLELYALVFVFCVCTTVLVPASVLDASVVVFVVAFALGSSGRTWRKHTAENTAGDRSKDRRTDGWTDCRKG